MLALGFVLGRALSSMGRLSLLNWYTQAELAESAGRMSKAQYDSIRPPYQPWPTYGEMKSIHSGVYTATREYRRTGHGRQHTYVLHGTRDYSTVTITSTGSWCSINAGDPNGDNSQIKSWLFIPQWPELPKPQPKPQQPHGGHPMGGYKRYPDYHVPADQFDFDNGGDVHIDARKHVYVDHGTIVHHRHNAPEHVVEGQAAQQRIISGQPQVNVKRGIFRQIVLGSGPAPARPSRQAQPQIAQPQEMPMVVDRGAIQAHTVPSRSQPALPYAPPIPMEVTSRQAVAAAFQQAPKKKGWFR